MHKSEKNKILQKIGELEEYLSQIKEILPPKKVYVNDLVKRRACEKTIELAIQNMIDISGMIISYNRLGIPSEENDIFDLLRKNMVVSDNLAQKMKLIKGFRNIITHKYGKVDDALAFDYMKNKLSYFYLFIDSMKKYLKK